MMSAAGQMEHWDGASAATLATALATPAIRCIETGLERGAPARSRRNCSRLSLVVTTRSAYRHPIGRVFVEALGQRLSMSRDLHDRLHTAIQEALMNAVLHGNLRIDSRARDSLEGLPDIHRAIEQKLCSSATALSAIEIEALWNDRTLNVIVRDSGAGYRKLANTSLVEDLTSAGRGRGRGLAILAGVCDRVVLLRGGSAIKLGFAL